VPALRLPKQTMALPTFLTDLGVTPPMLWGAGALLVVVLLTLLVSNLDMTDDDLNAVRAEAGQRMAAAARGQTRAMAGRTTGAGSGSGSTRNGGAKEE